MEVDAFDLPVDLRSSPRRRSQALCTDQKTEDADIINWKEFPL